MAKSVRKPARSASVILPAGLVRAVQRRLFELAGLAILAAAALLAAALLGFHAGDPSLNSATDAVVRNWLGRPGAAVADALVQTLGLAAAVPVLVLAVWGWRTIAKSPPGLLWLRLSALVAAVLLLAGVLEALPRPAAWPLHADLGGAAGQILLNKINSLTLSVHENWGTVGNGLLLVLPGLATLGLALGLSRADWARLGRALRDGTLAAVARLRILARRSRSLGRDLGGSLAATVAERRPRREPTLARAVEAVPDDLPDDFDDDDFAPVHVGEPDPAGGDEPRMVAKAPAELVAPKAPKPKSGRKAEAARQRTLDLGGDGTYAHPSLDLLELPEEKPGAASMNREALQQNAQLLASVLEDFGVRGEIVKVRPGPVVTLYELEPAPGTKTSRVIGLADDIARSMSAISVRVAVVPGRNVIGIELPNQRRELVFLRELLASEAAEKSPGRLNLALGKDIGGLPVIVDLARMPHLLIAGTTGSGKSVAVNTMILSLLYRLSPDECKFIMIDPKMLELSVYDSVPHLLTPVVTEPGKAVVALKWTVREMEDRYRAMSQLGVRNIGGYNQRLEAARKKGEQLRRRVQTGFDPETGQPVYEEQPLDMNPLPFIVVVVDEMADLMLVAGKDIEAAVQRLAQMARAAGIHLIMATQRPSVDVITGTIKANFPTRISFQVTSKIDSRTILGEQGAEQLLGQGDMLY
ncbi:MAG: DNA translocase FtsK 4TM domain-containing protein, partial [Hyphomicrobiales bacterium]|nr:DNA translocase FtsK 4TM domain-containing protein [Hyphomicrobiales bacterium]